MFPTLQNRAREAFADALDRAVEFSTLGEYRYLAVEPEVAPDAPAEPGHARRAAATFLTGRGRVCATHPGTSGSAADSWPHRRHRSPRTLGRARGRECGRASLRSGLGHISPCD